MRCELFIYVALRDSQRVLFKIGNTCEGSESRGDSFHVY